MQQITHPFSYPRLAPQMRRAGIGGGIALLCAILGGLLCAAQPTAAQSSAGVITYAGADHNIWRIGVDGSDRRQLTQDGTSDAPVWVPGGRQIAFQSIRDSRVITVAEGPLTLNQIYLMGSDGSTPTLLSDGKSDDKFPEISANGSRIVLIRNRNWRLQNGQPGARHGNRQYAARRQRLPGAWQPGNRCPAAY